MQISRKDIRNLFIGIWCWKEKINKNLKTLGNPKRLLSFHASLLGNGLN
jgi:hypothetical protein